MNKTAQFALAAGVLAALGISATVYARKNPEKVVELKTGAARFFTTARNWLARHGVSFLRWRPQLAKAA